MSEQWTPPPSPTWDDLRNEVLRLRAENARLRKLLQYDRHAMVNWLDAEYSLPGCEERIDAIGEALREQAL
jgi:hypothetical protein